MKWTPSASGERSREAAGPEEEEDRERESKRESERAAMIRASVCSPWGDSDDKKRKRGSQKWKMENGVVINLIAYCYDYENERAVSLLW